MALLVKTFQPALKIINRSEITLNHFSHYYTNLWLGADLLFIPLLGLPLLQSMNC
jgi:hypothetical protein